MMVWEPQWAQVEAGLGSVPLGCATLRVCSGSRGCPERRLRQAGQWLQEALGRGQSLLSASSCRCGPLPLRCNLLLSASSTAPRVPAGAPAGGSPGPSTASVSLQALRMSDGILSKAATMEIPISSNGDTSSLPEDDGLEQVRGLGTPGECLGPYQAVLSLHLSPLCFSASQDLQQVMVSGPNLNETSIVSGGYGGTAEGIIPTGTIKGIGAGQEWGSSWEEGARLSSLPLIYVALPQPSQGVSWVGSVPAGLGFSAGATWGSVLVAEEGMLPQLCSPWAGLLPCHRVESLLGNLHPLVQHIPMGF